MSEFKLLIEIKTILEELDIKYFVTGSWASTYYGIPRATHDIDIVINLKTDDIEEFFNRIDGLKYYIDKEMVEKAVRNKSFFQLLDKETAFKINFWLLKDDEWDYNRISNRNKVIIDNTEIYFSSAEDIILAKLLWSKNSGGSQKQIIDIKAIYQNQDNLDETYIKKFVDKMNLNEEYVKIGKI